ncbi:MAG: hypothetical protein HYZ57_11470 [Acidobacteria bacterium]|nr:hypothetical protein [Acidobacteriota bacterium]
MASEIRGVRNLKTLSGRSDPVAFPYQGYMQITCLEMEKARRGAERRSATQRIAEIDARLREIEEEKAGILKTLSGQDTPAGLPGRASGCPPTPPRGLKIRY